MSTHVVLARRPGWRLSARLTDQVVVDDGRLRLADEAPPSVFDSPPQRLIDLPKCQRGVVDIAGKRVLIVSGTGQIRLILSTPTGPWKPVGLIFLAPDRLAVLDAARLVHLFDCHGTWLETVADLPDHAAVVEPRFVPEGSAVTVALDSGLPGCRWHRLALTGHLPQGTQVEVETFTTDLDLTEAEVATLDGRWSRAGIFSDPELTSWDALVAGPGGQYLWMRATLRGDRTATPILDRVEVHFPRQTSLSYLPAVYSTGESDFLERFLALTDTVRDSVTELLDQMAWQLDPRSADADGSRDFLKWLGTWVGMTDIGVLPEARQRRLIAAAAELYRRRGTPDGVARHVGLWLGREVRVLEHFRLRRWAVADRARLGDASVLFGDDIVRRLRLDEYATIGEFALVGVPSPRTDPFRVFAHTFTLFVHACGDDDVDALTAAAARIASAVAPAHCLAHVDVVTATATVGLQSRLGLDAVVAGPPPAGHLGDRLGMVLAGDPRAGGLASVGIDARVGTRATIG